MDQLTFFQLSAGERAFEVARQDVLGRDPAPPALAQPRMTPTQHGEAGAEDSARHLSDHMPGWLLERLGDALLMYVGREFTSEDIRRASGQVVNDWLSIKGRENCFPGWWRSRIRTHKLERTGRDEIAQREDARGRRLPIWRFP